MLKVLLVHKPTFVKTLPATSILYACLLFLSIKLGINLHPHHLVNLERYRDGKLRRVILPTSCSYVSWFAFGHITPFVHLSNKLASHGVQISFLSAPGNIQRISLSLTSSPLIKIIPVQFTPVDGLPPGLDSNADMSPALSGLLKIALDKMQPQIKSILINLKTHMVFIDTAQHWSLIMMTNPYRVSPTIDDLKKPPPGTFLARDFLYPFKSFNGNPSVNEHVQTVRKSCDAIVMKSRDEMEGPYLDYIRQHYGKPVLLTGPLVPEPPKYKLEEKREKWLQKFPSKSVVFCSFGSETFLKDDQIKELLLGLEQTGLPFFLVLNFPPGGGNSNEKLKNASGVKEWCTQQAILAHDSVGGYVCHSGLSFVIEAFMNDFQLVMLPQKGDQLLNSMLFSGDLEAGVQVSRDDEDGHFNKEDLLVIVGVNEESGKSVSVNHGKWRDFLLNKDIQDDFITKFVAEMKKNGQLINSMDISMIFGSQFASP
ncbi:hypothetical protein MKX01_007709 [Papaver californicum]|nr:hypothetical protein MKX01_007709 [Papaver californicum]